MLKLKGPSLGISGRFKIDVLNSKGKLVEDKCLPEQKNLVTEAGLSALLSDGSSSLRLILGTGSTPPQREDIRLDNALVASPSSLSYNGGTMLSDTSFEISNVFTFNLGQVVGNITELGLAYTYSNLSTYSLATRALIKDALGNATSIEILEDEQIKITYTLKAEITDSSEPYTISVNKDGVLEEHTITPTFKIKRTPFLYRGTISTQNARIDASTGSNSSIADSSTVRSTFSPDRKTYSREYKGYVGIGKWNGGVRWVGVVDFITGGATGSSSSFVISGGSPSSGTTFIWQIDPPINKTNEQVMEITCTVSATYGD